MCCTIYMGQESIKAHLQHIRISELNLEVHYSLCDGNNDESNHSAAPLLAPTFGVSENFGAELAMEPLPVALPKSSGFRLTLQKVFGVNTQPLLDLVCTQLTRCHCHGQDLFSRNQRRK